MNTEMWGRFHCLNVLFMEIDAVSHTRDTLLYDKQGPHDIKKISSKGELNEIYGIQTNGSRTSFYL